MKTGFQPGDYVQVKATGNEFYVNEIYPPYILLSRVFDGNGGFSVDPDEIRLAQKGADNVPIGQLDRKRQ